MIRKTSAVWRGNGRDGSGTLSSQSGALSGTTFGYKSRFENGPGTNPEELLAAAHAGCFTMAVAFGLQMAGFTATELDTEAAVSIEPQPGGFRIARSSLTLRGRVPGVDELRFREIAEAAEKNCPISRVLNAQITLDATLVTEAVPTVIAPASSQAPGGPGAA